MKLTHIRDLVAIAQRGGLRRAARQLGLAQPAISRSIRELEQELGAELFVRTSQGMELTAAGAAFYHRVRAVQADLERACDEVRELSGRDSGVVSVGLATAPLISLLPRVLGPFRRRYPDALLRVTEGLFPAIDRNIEDGTIDFYVGPLSEVSFRSAFASEKLFDNERVVIARRGHPLAHASRLAELTEGQWIATSVTADYLAELAPLFEARGLPGPRIAARVDTGLAAIAMLSSSDLLALLPRQWAAFAARTDLLGAIAIQERLEAPPMCLITRSALPLTPVAQHLADLFRRAALHSQSSAEHEALLIR